jgi:hypothetical protein
VAASRTVSARLTNGAARDPPRSVAWKARRKRTDKNDALGLYPASSLGLVPRRRRCRQCINSRDRYGNGPQHIVGMPNNLATIKQVQRSAPAKLKSPLRRRLACFGFDRGCAIRLPRSRIRLDRREPNQLFPQCDRSAFAWARSRDPPADKLHWSCSLAVISVSDRCSGIELEPMPPAS